MKTLKLLDLFAGISGFRHSLENLGLDYDFNVETVGWSEIDKQAKKSYRALYNPDENGEIDMDDIVNFNDNRMNELDNKEIDILTGGFPCQSFSALGNRMGFADPKGRGLMFFQIMRLLEHRKNIGKQIPFVMLENVKGLLTHDGGNTFNVVIESLKSLDYKVYYDVFNAFNFKIPQSRRRVAIFATTLDLPEDFNYTADFIEEDYRNTMRPGMHVLSGATSLDFLDKEVDPKYYISDQFKKCVLHKIKPRVPDITGLNPLCSPTLIVSQRVRCSSESYYSQDFLDNPEAWGTTKDHTYEEMFQQPIRRLNPYEKMRHQGFEDYMTQRLIDAGCSDTNINKRAGNSICVPMFYGIFEYLLEKQGLINQLGYDGE